MAKKQTKTAEQCAAIRAHVASVAGLSDDERERLAAILVDPGRFVVLDKFGEPDAAQRFTGLPDGLPPLNTRWFAAYTQQQSGLVSRVADRALEPAKLNRAQRDDLLDRHAFARFMARTLLDRCNHRPPDAATCRAVLVWETQAERIKRLFADYQLPLVVWYATRFKRTAVPPAERVSVCCVELLRAIDDYDPRLAQFSTHAVRYMLNGLLHAGTTDKRRRGDYITESACAVREDGSGPLANTPGGVMPPDELHLDLADILAEPGLLTEREQRILAARYGVDLGAGIAQPNGEALTLEQVGQLVGLTRERVRQVEAGALEKLRSRFAGLPIPADKKQMDARLRARKLGRVVGADTLESIAPTSRENSTIRHVPATI
ncbi:MAG: sigma-70 family RNA polymerase sigma factor [Planctomycetota bacterium]